ncbi:MAG: molybdopterin-binding protein [Rudaea sp.]
MKLENARLEEAVGTVLVHNVSDVEGHKLLSKGHLLTAEDVEKLRALGRRELYVARLEPGDVRENQAVQRIARALTGENMTLSAASSGRVNALASARGVFKANAGVLAAANAVDGVTAATVAGNVVVKPKQMVATYKTIGLALPETALARVEAIAREQGPAISITPLREAQVAVIFTGSPEARQRVEGTFTEPIRGRVEELGGRLLSWDYVPEESGEIAGAIKTAEAKGAHLILLAGETSIMDRDDITPRGIRQAGGELTLFGAPVEPGNLLLLAFHGDVAIVGAPGCIKSRETNVVDLILPRLLAGEKVSRADVIELANGGLLI